MGQRLRRPTLEISIVTVLAVGFEQGDRIAVSLDLHLIVGLVELLAVLGLQIIQQLLVLEMSAVDSVALTLPPSTIARPDPCACECRPPRAASASLSG